jgi:hypothetical protein
MNGIGSHHVKGRKPGSEGQRPHIPHILKLDLKDKYIHKYIYDFIYIYTHTYIYIQGKT